MANALLVSRAVELSLLKIDSGYRIKPKQLEAIISVVSGQDTIAILPTSYGESLIFRLIPSVCQQLRGHTHFAIITSP